MARKDLAALAALGTLGYMMSNKGDKKGSVTERQIAADKEANAEPQSMEDDSGMDAMEAANKRTERTLTPNERGAAGTSETVFPSARTTSKPATAKPAATSSKDYGKSDETSSLLSRYKAPETMTQKNERYRQEMADLPIARGARDFFGNADKRYLQSKLDRGETLSPMEQAQAKRAGMAGFKRGGRVKKMASGGMTSKVSSASKRADGIATKGKTRGRMV